METKNLNFVFWQQYCNIHEAALIGGLADRGFKVIVVTESGVSKVHAGLGVPPPNYGEANILSLEQGLNFIKNNEELRGESAIHILTGVRCFNLTRIAFNLLKNTKSKIYAIAESRDPRGLKGILRKIDTSIGDVRVNNRLNGFFAVGRHAQVWFGAVPVPPKNIYPFGWFVRESKCINYDRRQNELLNIVFVGQLINRKGVDLLLDAISKIDENFRFHLNIIGDGVDREFLKNKAEKISKDKISFLGKLHNNQVRKYMEESDVLVLPSRFDGWGAVVPEALLSGTRVICSLESGASLLESSGNVATYTCNDTVALKKCLVDNIERGPVTAKERNERILWARGNFGEYVLTKYFTEIVCGKVKKNHSSPPVMYWTNTSNIK